jgi:dolichol-phosphate mannosyltransferase
MDALVGSRVEWLALTAPTVYVIVDWVCVPPPLLTWPPFMVAMNTPEPRPRISAVVPAYNEVECLPVLVTELRAALESTGRTWEMVLVDDGSGDGTGEAMEEVATRDPRIRVIRLERNAGQSAALAAGLLRAHGEVLVMDADRRNPADIPALPRALEHADVVSGVRAARRDDW